MRVTAHNLAALSGIAHGFCTRHGGVSTGRYASLNTAYSTEDKAENVAENRRRIAEALGMTALVAASQVHGVRVVEVTTPWPREHTPEADAMVTRTPGLLLGIQTADCAPILFADAEAGVVGAAHAGWRGALDGVAEETVAAMEKLGAQRARIVAAVGPCIGAESYEVGAEFRAGFMNKNAGYAAFFLTPPPSSYAKASEDRAVEGGKYHFDLKGFIAAQLEACGIAQVEILPQDTLADTVDFFSHRRATLEGDARTGRQMSVIGIRS
ncbi:MAG: peptidoglycan editing factor PgeF [Alphaproteobacteria bacterium]|nr:peptidoglycan editing factor PgeF [Alphaproteobacteria bacterium]